MGSQHPLHCVLPVLLLRAFALWVLEICVPMNTCRYQENLIVNDYDVTEADTLGTPPDGVFQGICIPGVGIFRVIKF